LRSLRRRFRRLLWIHGISRVTAVLVGALLVVGLSDWLIHLDDPELRLVLGAGTLAFAAAAAWRHLVEPLRRGFSDADAAFRIEQRFPEFRDSLASTVQFLEEQNDQRLGSPEMQRRVISETLARLTGVDVAEVIESRFARRSAALAAVVCLAAAMLVGANPPAAKLALERLMSPYAASAWPRQTSLVLLTEKFEPVEYRPDAPLRVVRDAPLEFFIEDAHGQLPDDLRWEIRVAGGALAVQTPRRVSLRDERGEARELAAARVPTGAGPVHFRAVGGDDDTMPQYELQIVPPPVVESLQVSLTPPAYSGLPSEQLSPGAGSVQGLVGTQVDVAAAFHEPLAGARLRVRDKPAETLELEAGGRTVRARFVLDEPGVYAYGFDLTDQLGFEHVNLRYEVRSTADLVPQVSIEQPESDLTVTPNAEIPVRIIARDDLSLRDIRLRYQLGDSTDAASAGIPIPVEAGRPGPVDARLVWKLAELRLTAGMRLVYHAQATDDFNLGPEHVGNSPSRQLILVSHDEKAAEIASRQSSLLEQLQNVRGMQSQAREQAGELELQWSKAGELRTSDVDLLKRLELEQRRIAALLDHPEEGLSAQAARLRDELKRNRVESPETDARLDRMEQEVARLRESQLPSVGQQLTEALKEAENAAAARNANDPNANQPDAAEAARRGIASLQRAQRGQSAVVESLDAMLRELGRWRSRHELLLDLAGLIARQQELNHDAAETGKQTLAKPLPELSPQEQADLARLAERQSQQRERLLRFRADLDKSDSEANETAAAPRPFEKARELLEERRTGDTMREAAERLAANGIGQAMIDQRQILDDLENLARLLEQSDQFDLESRLAQLRAAEENLETLRKKQDQVAGDAQRLAQPEPPAESEDPEELRKRQNEVRNEAQSAEPALRRLAARRSGDALNRAASQMQRAEQNLEQGRNAPAAESANEALEDIRQAQRELARARREVEEQLARESIEKMADALNGMVARQQSVIDETVRLDAERQRRGNWSRAQLKSLANLTENQRMLKGETDELVARLQGAIVFARALEGAAEQMERAADRLEQRLTDAPTLDAERRAHQRFVDLAASLENNAKEAAAEAPPTDGGQEGDAGAQPPLDAVTLVAQLKVLKLLQEDLAQRTTAFDREHIATTEPNTEEKAELARLAEEQARLSELARELAQSVFGGESETDEAAPKEP